MYNLFIWEIYENPMAFQNNKIIQTIIIFNNK